MEHHTSDCMNLDQIFNASQDFQVVVSLDHTIKQINSSYLRYLGLTREAAVGSKCRGLLKGALCEGRDCPLKRVIEDQKIIEIEVLKRGYDGVATPFLLTATPLTSFDNNVVGMIASHDIGKIYVPSEFLTKPGKLSNIEFEIIKTHSQKGYDILKSIPFNCSVAEIVLQHHERMDGSGYPCGLNGDSVLLEAKIIGVADVVEAISSDRPYRKGLGMEAALEELEKNKGTKYDADVVNTWIKIQKEMS